MRLQERGAFTFFANPAHLSAIALPGRFRSDDLPSSIGLIGIDGTDRALNQQASVLEALKMSASLSVNRCNTTDTLHREVRAYFLLENAIKVFRVFQVLVCFNRHVIYSVQNTIKVFDLQALSCRVMAKRCDTFGPNNISCDLRLRKSRKCLLGNDIQQSPETVTSCHLRSWHHTLLSVLNHVRQKQEASEAQSLPCCAILTSLPISKSKNAKQAYF